MDDNVKQRRQGAVSSCPKRQCAVPECEKFAVSKRLSFGHGGGRRCKLDGCTTRAVGSSGLCYRHGGGKRCAFSECTRVADRTNYCSSHRSTMGTTPLSGLTQNVCGLNKPLVHAWLRAVANHDIVLLQETQVQDKSMMEAAVSQALGPDRYSLWTEGSSRSCGVGIISRYPLIAWSPESWTPRLMTPSVQVNGAVCFLANVYAPCGMYREREQLFESLDSITQRYSDLVIVGGDFNNTLDADLNRSHPIPSSPAQRSPALERVLA